MVNLQHRTHGQDHPDLSDVDSFPWVSIVIPMRNERKYLTRCLEHLWRQDYPAPRLEILVVDGMSTDGSRELLQELATRSPVAFRILDNPKNIVPSSMNLGIRAARGTIIVRIDARCFAEPDYVANTVKHLMKEGVFGAAGPQVAVGENYWSRVIAAAMNSRFGMGSPHRYVREGGKFTDTFYLGGYTKETIEKAGYFDERFLRNQDYEFNCRVRKLVGPIFCAHDIRSLYIPRGSLGPLFKQFRQFGYWKTRTMKKHGGQWKLRHFVAPLFVSVTTALAIASLFSQWGFILLLLELALYGCASLLATWQTYRKREVTLAEALALPLVFFVIHWAWGTGFIQGSLTLPWNEIRDPTT